jgi:hypothetical protein
MLEHAQPVDILPILPSTERRDSFGQPVGQLPNHTPKSPFQSKSTSYSEAYAMSDAKFREESKNLIDFDLYSSRLTAINRDYTEVTGQYGGRSSVLPCYS